MHLLAFAAPTLETEYFYIFLDSWSISGFGGFRIHCDDRGIQGHSEPHLAEPTADLQPYIHRRARELPIGLTPFQTFPQGLARDA